MRFLELFSGSGIMSRTATNLGFEAWSVDIDPHCTPDQVADITQLQPQDLEHRLPGHLTVIWASPDCRQFSYARGARNEFRESNPDPLSEDALEALEMVKHTLYLIEQLDPTYWALENPLHGALKNQPFMRDLAYVDVSYCCYNYPFQKRTRIWGKFPPSFVPKDSCSHGSHQNIKTYKDAKARSEIPFQLCYDFLSSARRDNGLQLPTLGDFT